MGSLSRIPSWEAFASSAPFAVTVGAGKKKFYIHSALLASLSEPLNRLVNGDFKEAQEAHVTLDHVDEETFAYFVQWTYTGKYSVLLPIQGSGTTGGMFSATAPAANFDDNRLSSGWSLFGNASPAPGAAATAGAGRGFFENLPRNPGAAAAASAGTSLFGSASATSRASPSPFTSTSATVSEAPTMSFGSAPRAQGTATTNNATPRSNLFGSRPVDPEAGKPKTPAVPPQSGYDALWTKFTNLFEEESGIWATDKGRRFEPTAIRSPSPIFPNENDKTPNPLLTHARIFLLADYYDVVPLSHLSFREMGRALINRYKDPKSFKHPWQIDHVVQLIEFCWGDAQPAKLRDAVALYAACHFETLIDNELFLELHRTNAELATDIALLVAKRLKSP